MIDAVVDPCRRSRGRMPRRLLGYQAKMPRIACGRQSSERLLDSAHICKANVRPDASARVLLATPRNRIEG